VLVIGTHDRDDLGDAAQRASSGLTREVNVTFRSADSWPNGADGFHTEIKSRPLVPVPEPESSSSEVE
jgi:hypothetical protein